MIEENKRLMDVRMEKIFGERVDRLTPKEIEVARRVLNWVDGQVPEPNENHLVAEAVKRSVCEVTGLDWNIISKRSRRRDLVEARAMAYSLMSVLGSMPKSAIARHLGIDRDHATVLVGIRLSDDLRFGSASYRESYDKAYASSKKYIDNNEIGEEEEYTD